MQPLRLSNVGYDYESNQPQVFTPPRDDPATRPRFAQSPRELDNKGLENETRMATRQACMIVFMFFFTIASISAIVIGLYQVTNAMVGKSVVFECPEQPIENGVIEAGDENASAVIRCDEGYKKNNRGREVTLTCHIVFKRCRVYKRALQVESESLYECDRRFMYRPPTEGINRAYVSDHKNGVDEVPDVHSEEVRKHLAAMEMSVYQMAVGSCSLDPMEVEDDTESLFAKPSGSSSLLATTVESAPSWSNTASSLCLCVLAVVSLGAVITSAVTKGRGRRRDYELGAHSTTSLLEEDSS